ncbi:unnamed protein product [Polarella glacialis]|uniref:Uncharacterized protein n=1 Tax=Polarella glacialis TaxID=89957 RepID=A0A813ID85_POLGL|nr:unnamed protein product [Polarella glacialis]
MCGCRHNICEDPSAASVAPLLKLRLARARSLLRRLGRPKQRGFNNHNNNTNKNNNNSDALKKYLLWQVPAAWDAQGLSDRRACLAVVLAEAFLLGRVAVLPLFTLDAGRHNNGLELEDTDLTEYVSLEHMPVETIPALVDLPEGDLLETEGPLDPQEWLHCPVRVLLRRCADKGFWRSEVHPSVLHLAGELHGTGMKPTPGLFGPSERVARAAAQAAASIGAAFVGVHVRRGDKLEMMAGLADATSAEAVARRVAGLAPVGVGHVYVASNDHSVDYASALSARGFCCHGPELFRSLMHDMDVVCGSSNQCTLSNNSHLNSELGSNSCCSKTVGNDCNSLKRITRNAGSHRKHGAINNHLLFAMEMKLVDDAAVSIRTFNDATPWFWSQEAKPAYHLLDRSMHDYVFGFSSTGTGYSGICTPLDLTLVSPQEAYNALSQASADPRTAFLRVLSLPRLSIPVGSSCIPRTLQALQSEPCFTVALFEGRTIKEHETEHQELGNWDR